MASAIDILKDWRDTPDKQSLYATHSGLILRWLNEGQLRFADKSEILRSTWTPTITSTGNIALPSDFLRAFKDRVQRTSGEDGWCPLCEINYQDAIHITFGDLTHYSVYGNTFYVWAKRECTPLIPYIKKPAIITSATLGTAELEIPTENHEEIVIYLDAMWAKRVGDLTTYKVLLNDFDSTAKSVGLKYRLRRDAVPMMR